ncbi:MAG TPA: hypothetical protein PKM63_13860 [Panacibacter sp.]|nr:hypothetical protein [Panacibacter sp.]HNP45370.1 hypothetical protein [Panacibacter sp.]
MRNLILILSMTMLGACGNKLNSLEYAGKKVSETVNACKEKVESICPDIEKAANSNEAGLSDDDTESTGTSAATSWDTHMMLW